MKSAVQSRDPYWDNAKSILIFLVVLGHFLILLLDHTKSQLVQVVFTYIYMFHMPAFIMISGYFSKKIVTRPSDPNRFIGLFLAFLAFKGALWIIESIVSHRVLVVGPFSTPSAPWYLMCLAWWYLLLPVIYRLGKWPALAVSVILMLLVGADPNADSFLCLDKMINFLPFFLIGFYYEPARKPSVRSAAAGFGVLAAFFVLLYVFFGSVRPYTDFMYGDKLYASLDLDFFPGVVFKLLWMLAALILVLAFLQIVPARQSIITRAGRNSLGIYVFHRLVRPFMMPILWGEGSPLDSNGYVLLASSIIVSILVTAFFSIDIFTDLINKILRAQYVKKEPA